MSSSHDPSLHLLPAPVAVIGVAADGVLGGLTAAWLTRVSSDPPLLAVSVAPERRTWELLDRSGEFTVSILAEDQVPVGRVFGLLSRRDRDKWAETDHVLLGEGTPALADCVARLLCRLVGRHAAGDHEIFVGEVTASEVLRGAPALPMRGRDWAP